MKKQKVFKAKQPKGTKTFTSSTTKKKAARRVRNYSSEWAAYRFRFLHYNTSCYSCGYVPPEGERNLQVDHIIPAKVDEDKYFWKEDNYIPLCHSCHSTVTALYDKFNPPKTEEKLEWLGDMRTRHNITKPVKVVPIRNVRNKRSNLK